MWENIKVVFYLKSPLHIGYRPFNGSVVSPTRYYVLGRSLWGAITKGVTEYLYGENPGADDYKGIGEQIRNNFRFSYFYLYDGKTIYFPNYTDNGIKYGDEEKITKSEFEDRFVGSRISTAIDGNTGTAEDESLHEIEYINNKFKDENEKLNDVMLDGHIWIREGTKIEGRDIKITDNGIFIDNFNIIQELILGGESKYGFGHVKFFSCYAYSECKDHEKVEMNFDKPLIAHLIYNENIKFEGDIELLSGREYPKLSQAKYYISPGSKIIKNGKDSNGEIKWDGTCKADFNISDYNIP